jgi:hypothetical protein
LSSIAERIIPATLVVIPDNDCCIAASTLGVLKLTFNDNGAIAKFIVFGTRSSADARLLTALSKARLLEYIADDELFISDPTLSINDIDDVIVPAACPKDVPNCITAELTSPATPCKFSDAD